MSAAYDNKQMSSSFKKKMRKSVLASFQQVKRAIFPRVGEIVSLPRYEGSEGGYYVITHIVHSFIAEPVANDIKFCSRRFYVRKANGDDMPRRSR